jgi:hypothetical protein
MPAQSFDQKGNGSPAHRRECGGSPGIGLMPALARWINPIAESFAFKRRFAGAKDKPRESSQYRDEQDDENKTDWLPHDGSMNGSKPENEREVKGWPVLY